MTPAPKPIAPPEDRTNPHHARDHRPCVDPGPINPPRYGD